MKQKREGEDSIVEHSPEVFPSDEKATRTMLLEMMHEATELANSS